MKELFILIILFSMHSCKKNNEDLFISTAFDISYFDEKGNDLLDPDSPDSYKEADIDIYFLINEEKVRQYQGNLEFPDFFYIHNETIDSTYKMVLFPNHSNLDNNNRAITYINFGNDEEDKIECEFQTYKNSSSIQVIKIWYNDKLEWQFTDGASDRWIEIIK